MEMSIDALQLLPEAETQAGTYLATCNSTACTCPYGTRS